LGSLVREREKGELAKCIIMLLWLWAGCQCNKKPGSRQKFTYFARAFASSTRGERRMKTLILAAIFGLIVLFVRSWLRLLQPTDSATKTQAKVSTMVPCSRCGLHVPLEESVEGKDGGRYCCRKHAEN